MLLSRVQSYILKQCLSAFALVVGIFVITILLVDTVEQMRTVGSDVELGPLQALQLSLMKLPSLIEQTLPFAILVAAIIAFNRLSKRSELPVIRASGLSAWQFLAPVVIMALALGLLTMTLINPFGARLSSTFESTRASLLDAQGETADRPREDIWLRQGSQDRQIIIHADSVNSTGQVFSGVKMIEEDRIYAEGSPTNSFEFVRRIDASEGRITDGFWQLEDIVENSAGRDAERFDTLAIPTDIQPDELLSRFTSPNTIGFWDLPGFISQTKSAGLDASRFSMRWFELTAVPVLFIAMGLIGALVCLRLSRLSGNSRLVAIGAGAAVGLFFITQLASSLGASGALPPLVAAWAPAAAALFTALAILAYREDG